MSGWVYKPTQRNLWTVGFYEPDGTWVAESDHRTADRAAERVHWLNGGRSWAERMADGGSNARVEESLERIARLT